MTSTIFAAQFRQMASEEQYRSLTELVSELQKEIDKIHAGAQDAAQLTQLVDDARELYERLLIIRHKVYENLSEESQEEVSIPFSIPSEDEDLVEEVAEDLVEEQEADPDVVLPEDSIEEVEEMNDAKQTSLIDAIQEEEKSLVDQFAEDSEEQSLAERLERSPIDDLPKAIGLNQKFLFINELFAGDTETYDSAIQELNSCSDIGEALTKLKDIQNGTTWENEAVASEFNELIQRRYISVG
ncbi:MAG: hypothetical protein HKN32_01945 [Flavobacteriales bacterium]|nr:hypothetical protein [Flavobacteriales bacterium]